MKFSVLNEISPLTEGDIPLKQKSDNSVTESYNIFGKSKNKGNCNEMVKKDPNFVPLSANNFYTEMDNYESTKCSLNSLHFIKAYAANTNQGIVRYLQLK